MPDSVVIVGASVAGLTAAETLRQEGFDGAVTIIGAERHLPYDRPPLSKQLLSGLWEPDRLRLRTAEQLARLNVRLRLGVRATGLDTRRRTVQLAEGAPVRYDGLVIATGCRPRRVSGDGFPGVHYLRTIDDALALRRRLVRAPGC